MRKAAAQKQNDDSMNVEASLVFCCGCGFWGFRDLSCFCVFSASGSCGSCCLFHLDYAGLPCFHGVLECMNILSFLFHKSHMMLFDTIC